MMVFSLTMYAIQWVGDGWKGGGQRFSNNRTEEEKMNVKNKKHTKKKSARLR